MTYLALASDYDGTLATEGQVPATTVTALQRWRSAGRQLFLVTGRELQDLLQTFPAIDLFDQVVAENGPLIYTPATGAVELIAAPPPPAFVAALTQKQVAPLIVGQVIVAAWQPHGDTVLETIQDLGLDWQVILNKRAVMALPRGMNKAAGLAHVLKQYPLTPEQVVGVGDAENDQDMLAFCGYGVAVANALPAVKAAADWVTRQERGAGVEALIQRLLAG